jgi:hypothetical protein
MTIRALSVVVACVLSGCTAKDLYLPKCSGQVSVPQSRAAPCMTSAEYHTARKKAKNSQEEAAAEKDKNKSEEGDPRYKEWVP